MASRKNGKGEPDVKIGPVYNKKVERKLDPEAIERSKQELVEVDNRLISREAQAKIERKKIADEISGIKDERNNVLAAINSGIYTEETDVRDHMYLQTGNVLTKRVDTGEVVDERPMTAEERQTEMFALEGGKADPEASKATIADLQAEKAKRTKGKKGATPAEPSEEDFPPEAPF